MKDLIAFLRARLEEDEEFAREAHQRRWRCEDNYIESETGQVARFEIKADARHATCHDPARVLAEVEAQRQLLHAHFREHECVSLLDHGEQSAVDGQPWEYWEPQDTAEHAPCLVLRCLALPYADRDGFREEWRP